jgi:hypothetical protein
LSSSGIGGFAPSNQWDDGLVGEKMLGFCASIWWFVYRGLCKGCLGHFLLSLGVGYPEAGVIFVGIGDHVITLWGSLKGVMKRVF